MKDFVQEMHAINVQKESFLLVALNYFQATPDHNFLQPENVQHVLIDLRHDKVAHTQP